MKNRTPKKHKKLKKVLGSILCLLLVLVLGLGAAELWYYPAYRKDARALDLPLKEDGNAEITVMSCNVRCFSPTDLGKKSWFYRAKLIADNIETESPDIIGFQEVTRLHFQYLTDTLQQYDKVITYRDDTFMSEGCPIFYRTDKFSLVDKGSFWLSETPEVMSKSWNAACYRICSYVILEARESKKQFVVFNTHLDHVSDEARIGGIHVVLDKIKQFGGKPAMIMGDFNCVEDSDTYRAATESFLDARHLTTAPDMGCTYQNWGEALDREPIDYLMISKTGFKVEAFYTVRTTFDGVYPSDHFPIVGKLRLTDG